MKTIKKLLCLLCAAAMLVTMLAACGGEAKSPTTPNNDTPSNINNEDNTPTEVVNIVWYVAGTAPNKPDDVIKALNEKSAADIGVTVEFLFQGSDDSQVVNMLATGDSTADIVSAASWFADYRTSATNNYFMDITDMLPEIAPDLYEKLPDVLWDGVKVGGRIYGVPTWKDTAETQFWIGEEVPLEQVGATDLFNSADVRLDSMTSVLEKLQAWMNEDPENRLSADGANYVYTMDKRGDWSIKIEWDLMGAQDLEIGVKNFESDHPTVQWLYDDPEYVEDLKTLKAWADSGISNGIAAAQVDSAPAGLVRRGIGWDGAQYTVWGGEAVGYNTILASAGGPFMKSTAALGSINCIPLNAKNPEAALKYLQYINTNAEYRNMLAYGIEGVNYEVIDGKYKALTGYDYVAPNYTMASFDMLLAPVEVPNADMYKVICDGVNTAPTNTLSGFSPDLSNLLNEISGCLSIAPEYAYALHRGDVADVDAAIAEYRAELEKLGLQTIIDELQRQIDEFVASK